MFAVARADHIEKAIGQALHEGKWVVCDRFFNSTRAYQGSTAGVPRGLINALERLTVGDFSPDITFILDIPPEAGLARAAERRNGTAPDRFESQELMQHERIRRAFLDIAEEEPKRCVVIDASQPEAMVAEDVWEVVLQRLKPMSLTAERTRGALDRARSARRIRIAARGRCACSATRRRSVNFTMRCTADACTMPGSSSGPRVSARRRSPIASPAPFSAEGEQGDARQALDRDHPVFRKVAALSHPNLLLIRRSWVEKSKRYSQWIGVEEVRRLRAFLGHSAGEGGWRVVVVDRADELNQNAANALLKALEEPPPRTLFLLISSAEGRLPVTIRSRTRTLRVAALAEDDLEKAVRDGARTRRAQDRCQDAVRRRLP